MSADDYEPCGLGICAANEGHAGTCAEASGWPDIPVQQETKEMPMQGIDAQIIDAIVHNAGTCPGCGQGGCFAGAHCPCEGCDCPTTPAHPPLSTTGAESGTGTHTERESAAEGQGEPQCHN